MPFTSLPTLVHGRSPDRPPRIVYEPPAAIPGFSFGTDQSWSSQVRLVQSVYEGGRMSSAFRSARLTKEQALLNYQTTIADMLLTVEV